MLKPVWRCLRIKMNQGDHGIHEKALKGDMRYAPMGQKCAFCGIAESREGTQVYVTVARGRH